MTFARLAKLFALALVVFALWRTRPPAEPPHVVILALPAASSDYLAAGTSEDWAGTIDVPPATPGAAFWSGLMSVDDDIGHSMTAIWSGQPAAARVLAAPARLFEAPQQAAVTGAAFLGSSSGAVVEAADITAGRLPAPYDRAIDAISSAVSGMRKDEWSDWLTVESAPQAAAAKAAVPAPRAQFQFARFTDTSYFFSPAYVASANVVTSTPFLRGLDRELRPIVASHAIALARRRLEAAAGLFREGADQRPTVVFDTVAEDAATVFAPDSTPSAVVEAAHEAIAAEVSQLRKTVGSQGVLLIIGGPTTTRQTGVAAWYRIVAGGGDVRLGGANAPATLSFESARAIVRYLAGFNLDAKEKALVPAALAGRFPIRAVAARTALPRKPEPPGQEWTAATLESIPGALGSGN